MKLYNVVNEANKRVTISTKRLIDLKRYYMSMYRHYMVKLYDESFIDDPTRYDIKQINRNILELGVKGLRTISGKIDLSIEQVRYAIYKNKFECQEVKDFLYLLYHVIKYKGYSTDIDNFYDTYNFGESSKQKVSLDLRMTGPLVNILKPYRVSKAILNCFIPIDKTVSTVSLNSYIWDVAMNELNIPDEDRELSGLFDKDLSHEEEVECCKLLFEGTVELDGKYAEVLINWLRNHKWLERGMTTTRKGLFDYIFTSYSEEMYRCESVIFSKLVEDGRRILAICDSTIFYESEMDEFKFPIGYFVIESGEEDRELFSGNALNGYTGEVYSIDYLQEEGIMYVGCPIELNVDFKDKKLFYDIEQIDIKCDSWFKDRGIEWEFDEPEEYEFTNYEKGTLEYRLYSLYREAQFGKAVDTIPCPENSKVLEEAKRNVMKYIKE